ncbi:MAG: hypothetical protein L3K05_08370, partial [Thermoplasmata archaeon]|nr:hypothetical protein [Thermoplasmata archaeon]
WNWSTNKSLNKMFVGDSWTASFNIINTGPPYALDPVLECITTSCKTAGAGALNGLYSWATYFPPNSTGLTTISFPLAQVHVFGPEAVAPPPSAPPPAPPVPPGLPIITTTPQPVLVPTPNILGQGIANFSLQATAAGFLGAGFMRVGMKNRPLAVGVAQKNAALLRRQHEDNLHIGRFQ